MQATRSPVGQARAHLRHDLRNLTYVVFDDADGGIVRNLNHEGIGVQAVPALRVQQIVRVRFELVHPKLWLETQGEVVWANASGECGIRFLDLPERTIRQLNEWIFEKILGAIPRNTEQSDAMFGNVVRSAEEVDEGDGLMVSRMPQKVIQLAPNVLPMPYLPETSVCKASEEYAFEERDWLARPLSGKTLAAVVDLLAVIAASLLFSVIFLSVVRESPKWPWNLAAAIGATILLAVLYWGFFRVFTGATLGVRLARLVGSDQQEASGSATDADRFR